MDNFCRNRDCDNKVNGYTGKYSKEYYESTGIVQPYCATCYKQQWRHFDVLKVRDEHIARLEHQIKKLKKQRTIDYGEVNRKKPKRVVLNPHLRNKRAS